jgi:hypothetical protein
MSPVHSPDAEFTAWHVAGSVSRVARVDEGRYKDVVKSKRKSGC